MKIDRLIGILSVLLQKDKVTAAELSRKFEVSRRTVLRDIEALGMAGIPIVSEQGKGGGFSIMDGYRVDRTILSGEDMHAILTGLRSLDSVSGTNRYRQLMDKISADESEYVSAGGTMIIDLANWDKRVVSDKIELIKTAVEQHRMIGFTYNSPAGETKREIEPYHIIYQWSSWYVWGFCTVRGDYRMFKLTRLTDLHMTGEITVQREVPPYSCDALRHTRGEVEATVRFDPSVKWRIIDEFGVDFVKYDENGNIIVTFTWSDAESLYRYILTFGEEAEIIAPAQYRKDFAKLAKKICDKYKT